MLAKKIIFSKDFSLHLQKRRLMCVALSAVMMGWHFKRQFGAVVESKLRWQHQYYIGITASHELRLCSCVPNLPSNHRWYCQEGPQAVDK